MYQRNPVSNRAALAVMSGIVGPVWLGLTIAGLSVVDAAFMFTLGWHPFRNPTMDWPSGLALGPHGAWMTAAFVGCGILLPLFARGVREAFGGAPLVRAGTLLITGAGLAMLLLGFPTDPTLAGGPRTWHGLLHDAGYLVLGLTLFPALLTLAPAWLRNAQVRWLGVYSLLTLALAIPAFVLKGALFYAFLIGMCAWFVVVSAVLWRHARAAGRYA